MGLNDVVIEVAIVDHQGQVLYDSLVNPRTDPGRIQKIQALPMKMVGDALTSEPGWAEIENTP